MDMSAIRPYEGDQSYIFISYCHKNKSDALDLIGRLISDGYRVWYDEGIDLGTEWDDYIAEHLDKCSLFIALLTKDYFQSDNCKDELKYVRDMDIKKCLVYLNEVELPAGIKLRFGRLQAIYKYMYDNPEQFYGKLYSTADMDICRGSDSAVKSRPAMKPEPLESPVKRYILQGESRSSRWRITSDFVLEFFDGRIIADYPDKLLNAPWKQFSNKIRRIEFQEGLETIGAYAFSDMSKLSEVVIPKSVNDIRSGAFTRCRSLKTVTMGSQPYKIRDFKDRKNAPSGTTVIWPKAFDGSVRFLKP